MEVMECKIYKTKYERNGRERNGLKNDYFLCLYTTY